MEAPNEAHEESAPPPQRISARTVRFIAYLAVVVALAVWWFGREKPDAVDVELPQGTLNLRMNQAVNNRNEEEGTRQIRELIDKWEGNDDLDELHTVSWGQNVLADRAKTTKEAIENWDAVIRRLGSRSDLDHNCRVVLAFAQMLKAKNSDLDPEDKIALFDEAINSTLNYSPYRTNTPYMLLAVGKNRKADYLSDPEAKSRLYDEVIREYGGMQAPNVLEWVFEARYHKANLAGDPEERKALLRKIADDGASLPIDKQGYVALAMRELAEASDDAAAAAIYDDMLERYKNARKDFFTKTLSIIADRRVKLAGAGLDAVRQLDRLAEMLEGSDAGQRIIPRLLVAKAKLLPGDQEKLALYNTVVEKYGGSPNVVLSVGEALRGQIRIAGNPAGSIASLDRALASLERGAAWKGRDFRKIELLMQKAKLFKSREGKLKLFRQVLDIYKTMPDPINYRTLESNLTSMNFELLDDTLTRQFIDEVSMSPVVDPSFRVWALFKKLEHLPPDTEAMELLEKTAEECFDVENQGVTEQFLEMMRAAKRRDWNPPGFDAKMASILDRIIAGTKGRQDARNSWIHMSALMQRAGLVDDTDRKMLFFDAVLGMPGQRGMYFNRIESLKENAALEKSRILGNPEILRQFYDGQIADATSPRSIADVLAARARNEPDKQEKIRVWDEIIARFGDDRTSDLSRYAARAMAEKAAAAEDRETSIALYRQLVEKYGSDAQDWAILEVQLARHKLVKLLEDPAERMAVLDEIIQAAEAHSKKFDAAAAMLQKADFTSDTAGKLAILDSLIKQYQISSDAVGFMLERALWKKAELSPEPARKLEVYEQILAMPPSETFVPGISQEFRVKAVLAKAGILGQPSYAYDTAMCQIDQGSAYSLAFAVALGRALKDGGERKKVLETLIQKFDGGEDLGIQRTVDNAKRFLAGPPDPDSAD